MPKPTNPRIPPSNESAPGMQILYADRSDNYHVSYVADIVYDTRDDMPLHLQMLYPGIAPMALMFKAMRDNNPDMKPPERTDDAPPVMPPASNKYPLIIFVPGSAWMKQECKHTLPNLTDFARQGYVVAVVEYRPSSLAPWPGFLCDVKAAIRYLRANAELFDIDKDRIAIWGDSSGGHAALLAGATGWTREFDDDFCADESSAVRAVVDFYGVSDIATITHYPRDPENTNPPPERVPENMLFRTNVLENPEVCAPANPLNYIHKDKYYPPFLIMHGDEDGTVPFNQSLIMYNKLVENDKVAELYKVRGGGHSWRFWTKEVLDVVSQFLRAYL